MKNFKEVMNEIVGKINEIEEDLRDMENNKTEEIDGNLADVKRLAYDMLKSDDVKIEDDAFAELVINFDSLYEFERYIQGIDLVAKIPEPILEVAEKVIVHIKQMDRGLIGNDYKMNIEFFDEDGNDVGRLDSGGIDMMSLIGIIMGVEE